VKLGSCWVGCRACALLCLIVPPVSFLPVVALLPLQVLNITCSCGNGLVPCIWPAGSLPGHGGNLTNIVFDGARFFRSNMAVAIKSLEKFVGTLVLVVTVLGLLARSQHPSSCAHVSGVTR